MTRRRTDLPPEFQRRPFTVEQALAAGVSTGRLRREDLETPFRGVRVAAGWNTGNLEGAARAYAPRLRVHQALGSVSAAALWQLPLPSEIETGNRVHVIVPTGRSRPTGTRVVARTIGPRWWQTVTLSGIAVASPALTLLTLARDLAVYDLAVVVDALRSTSEKYECLAHHERRPLLSIEELRELAENLRGIHGAAKLREAINFGAARVESPRETLLRWALVKIGGLPEPRVNVEVRNGGRKLGTPDLSYPDARLGIEYEGDEHRTDRSRWRGDIERVERFADAGWHLMRVSDADLFPDPTRMLLRIARRLQQFSAPLGAFAWPERVYVD